MVAIVEDKPGVLMRVSSLFRRRGFNIESLTVGHSESDGLSRMTIVVDGESAPIEQVEKQLYKLIDVVKVTRPFATKTWSRASWRMIKVRCNNVNRHELLDIANVFRADVVDIATNSIILQVVGDEDKIDGLIKMCEPYGIREITRTGRIAMVRGHEDHDGPRARAGEDRADPRQRRGGASKGDLPFS